MAWLPIKVLNYYCSSHSSPNFVSNASNLQECVLWVKVAQNSFQHFHYNQSM